MLYEHLAAVRKRLVCYGEPHAPISQKHICEHDKLYLQVLFAKTQQGKYFFLPLRTVLAAVTNTNKPVECISDLLEVDEFTIGACRVDIVTDPQTQQLYGQGEGEIVFSLPRSGDARYHDYYDHKLYKWRGTLTDGPKDDIPAYELDYFLYQIAATSILYETFAFRVVEELSARAEYSEDEKREFHKEVRALHMKLINPPSLAH